MGKFFQVFRVHVGYGPEGHAGAVPVYQIIAILRGHGRRSCAACRWPDEEIDEMFLLFINEHGHSTAFDVIQPPTSKGVSLQSHIIHRRSKIEFAIEPWL